MNSKTLNSSAARRLGLLGTLVAVACLALAAVGASAASASLGITSFDGGAYTGIDAGLLRPIGSAVTQAGSHPTSASTSFLLTQQVASDGWEYATEDLKDVVVDLPPGLLANVNALPTCADSELAGGVATNSLDNRCPPASQVGFIDLRVTGEGSAPSPTNPSELVPFHHVTPVMNMKPPAGKAALFGFQVSGAVFHVTARLRHDASVPGHYRARVTSLNAPQTVPLGGATFTLWGAPADPILAGIHGWGVVGGQFFGGDSCVVSTTLGCPAPPLNQTPKPFLSLPTSCEGPVKTEITVRGWQGGEDSASFLSHDLTTPVPNPVGNDGCNALEFDPTLEARPTTNVADSPSGLEVDLHVPQNEDPNGNATAHLRDTTVTLPKGMTINPAAANGLGSCDPAQIDLQGESPADCPDSSKLGTVRVDTPLLDHPVMGAVYIATPYDNPFNSLLALYVAIDDPQSGTVVKLPGEVRSDPVTGQLTATFKENPQVPFEDLHLHFFGGAGGSLRTPATCGTYTTESSLTPWSAPDSGPPATPSDPWAIEQGPAGGCANDLSRLPNAPSFEAGTVDPIAAAKSALVVNLRRADGTQQFSAVTLSPPQGLVGKLAGIPYCSEAALHEAAAKSGRAEEANPSCPRASYVGSVTAAAGAGPAPYYAPGKAYLTGPYKGAPLSLAIVTPATAGPFDLGTIVVRSALYVDRTTARITAVSDPIPTILKGIPLDVRSIQVRMDRPDFTVNPTSCDPSSFGGGLLTVLGQTTPLQSRFQVGECGRLPFKPKLTLSLEGGVKRNGHPALTATLQMPEGSANLASISVALPHSEFLEQSHIRTICTRVQFAADQCPAGAVYGEATVTTPLLAYPLSGPVYLRSSSNKLPDLVPDLRGPDWQPIKLESDGRIDSVRGGIRNTFDFVPDAAFTKLTLRMQGGNKGLLVNSRNICTNPARATVRYTAHNGATVTATPLLRAQCGRHHSKQKRARR